MGGLILILVVPVFFAIYKYATYWFKSGRDGLTIGRLLIGGAPLVATLTYLCLDLNNAATGGHRDVLKVATGWGNAVDLLLYYYYFFLTLANIEAFVSVFRTDERRHFATFAVMAILGLVLIQWGSSAGEKLSPKENELVNEACLILPENKAQMDTVPKIVSVSDRWINQHVREKSFVGGIAVIVARSEHTMVNTYRCVRQEAVFTTFRKISILFTSWMILLTVKGVASMGVRSVLTKLGILQTKVQRKQIADAKRLQQIVQETLQGVPDLIRDYQLYKQTRHLVDDASARFEDIAKLQKAHDEAKRKPQVTPEFQAEMDERIRSLR